ncbi:unnamed protein product [Urochloa humidicola]
MPRSRGAATKVYLCRAGLPAASRSGCWLRRRPRPAAPSWPQTATRGATGRGPSGCVLGLAHAGARLPGRVPDARGGGVLSYSAGVATAHPDVEAPPAIAPPRSARGSSLLSARGSSGERRSVASWSGLGPAAGLRRSPPLR